MEIISDIVAICDRICKRLDNMLAQEIEFQKDISGSFNAIKEKQNDCMNAINDIHFESQIRCWQNTINSLTETM